MVDRFVTSVRLWVVPFLLSSSLYSNDTLYYEENVKPIFKQTCNCHFMGGEGLEYFDTAQYALGLPEMTSSKYYESGDLNNLSFVPYLTAGSLDSSLLYIKVAFTPADDDLVYLKGDDSGGKLNMGGRMPAGGPYLSPREIETIGKWVLLAGGVDTNTFTHAPTSVQTRGPIFFNHRRLKRASHYVLPEDVRLAKVFEINGKWIGQLRAGQRIKLNPNKVYFIEEMK